MRQLDATHVEIKSMHTLLEARGEGIGRTMLNHLLLVAAARGYERVSLETGTMTSFEPARRMYRSAGFQPCAPFGEYTVNPYSVCMTLVLDSTVGRPGPGAQGESACWSGERSSSVAS
jgi:putative acetyltransferase